MNQEEQRLRKAVERPWRNALKVCACYAPVVNPRTVVCTAPIRCADCGEIIADMNHPRLRFMDPRFACRVCGCECDTAPADDSGAICPKHCDDHDYEYDRDRRGHFCRHCDEPRPVDW